MRGALEKASSALFPNYRQYPVVIVRGRDCRVWGSDGKEYLDFVAGIATCNLGHTRPEVTEAIKRQADEIIHVSNWYFNAPQIDLAGLLTEITGLERVFFCNSGAEAAEAAIKLARKRAFETFGPDRNLVVSLHGAFHGRTMKALTATDPKHHLEAFSPYPEGFVHIKPGDIGALRQHLPEACALFLEPIQGEGGVRPMDPAFLREAEAACREEDVLFILDEVQTGMGRCGATFAYQVYGVTPDVLTLAKGLGNGFPIGAVLAREKVAAHFGPGSHGSTFGGNPLACAAALATLRTLLAEDLSSAAGRMGKYFREKLNSLVDRYPAAVEVRGEGLLLGIELRVPAAPVVERLMERGFLVTVVQENTLRFTPPLTISKGDIDGLIVSLEDIVQSLGGASE
ncbi:MAG: aspartate aminotransferase family protein [bacterium]|nr:MAG: aspartate aminotransferase family protein [bacterium]